MCVVTRLVPSMNVRSDDRVVGEGELTLREVREHAVIGMWEVVIKVVQVAIVPLLLLIWQEQRRMQEAQTRQLEAVVRLQTQMEIAITLDSRLSNLEAWKAEHEGTVRVLLGEFREMQRRR